jgi:ribonuclease P protein component
VLARDRRVRSTGDWDTLFRDGYGVSGRHIVLRVRLTPGSRRVGVSVGKRVGGSVTRNLIKRRLRGLACLHWERLPEADIAIIARPGCAALTPALLETEFADIAGRASTRVESPR